jgi:hypothetical protein
LNSLLITEHLRLIVFKLKINRNSVPEGMAFYRPEATVNPSRSEAQKGKRIVSGHFCDAAPLIGGLGQTHVLVDAFYTNAEPGYACAHFVFSAQEHAQVAPRLGNNGTRFSGFLQRLLDQNFWVTDAYINPFVSDANVVAGVYSASIIGRSFAFKQGKVAEYLLGLAAAQPSVPAVMLEPASA